MSEFSNNALGRQAASLDASPQFSGYSGVEIIVDDDTSFFAGSRTGRVLTINNPWGTQAQANNIISAIQGFQYQPFSASGALLSPAAELGDGVTISGLYSGIYRMSRRFGPLMDADIEAPEDEEIDHEYPFEPQADRVYKREIAAAQASIAVNSSAITAEVARATAAEESLSSQLTLTASGIMAQVVSKTGGAQSSFGWSLDAAGFYLYSGGSTVLKATSAGLEISGKIAATSGFIGSGANGFTITASSMCNGMETLYDTEHNGVYLGTDGIACGKGAFRVTASGDVSAHNMTLTGTLNIGGSTITANNLRVGASQAAANYGLWTSGSNWGAAFGNASNATSGIYQSFFQAGLINATTGFFIKGGTAYGIGAQGFYCGDDGPYKAKSRTVVTGVTVSGVVNVVATNGLTRQVVSSIGVSTATLYYLGK